VDLFGEIAGVAFSPDSDRFFIGIADNTYPTFAILNKSLAQQQVGAFRHPLATAYGDQDFEDIDTSTAQEEMRDLRRTARRAATSSSAMRRLRA
jgi:hypothetical protein